MNASTPPKTQDAVSYATTLAPVEATTSQKALHKTPLTGRDVLLPSPSVHAPQAKKAPGAFKTISEVADDLDVQQHVLRFWETKFSQIRPLKRGGGRRYYRPEDLALLQKIHHLLYTEGYTIKGVQKLLKEKGKAHVMQDTPAQARNNNTNPAETHPSRTQGQATTVKGTLSAIKPAQKMLLQDTLEDLIALRAIIKPAKTRV